ncbi:hypothetical protein [Halomonas sp. NO4]|uniref:hypothetical protein n=1 Tax=Halomonas sp. NO4 TaxID=2484813 RepID=UPI0013D36C80|nr:hypothetical protein [Halomonas sp. NO4]
MFKSFTFLLALLVPFSAFAMDYSHPMAPTNYTECVSYATEIVRVVEYLKENEVDPNESITIFDVIVEEEKGQEKEALEMFVNDAKIWYKSSQYHYKPKLIYMKVLGECEIEIIEQRVKDIE